MALLKHHSPELNSAITQGTLCIDSLLGGSKLWSDQIEAKVKADVSELVEANPATALNAHKRSSFDALIQALNVKMDGIDASKK